MSWNYYDDYESAGDRVMRMEKAIAKRRKAGEPFEAVVCEVARGVPAKTFWGKAWCENLEAYSDYEYRLPRGRSYLRQGNVYDLEINEGGIFAYVAGSEIYEVNISIITLANQRWKDLKASLTGEVRNLVDLLSGQLGDGVMAAVTAPDTGLFPSPKQITLNCDCPDWADCCKHIAAVMYAVGVKLDTKPELLFKLRKVDHNEIIDAAGEGVDLSSDDASAQILAADELAELFGIDLAEPESAFRPQQSSQAV